MIFVNLDTSFIGQHFLGIHILTLIEIAQTLENQFLESGLVLI